jgi:hypothetical protein
MFRSCFKGIAAATVSVALSGCGTPPGYFAVSGKVLYKGEPASGAVVYFHRADGIANSQPAIPCGIADDDGSFYLTCDGVGNGCPAGQYAVLVEWKGKPETPIPQPKPTRVKGKAKAVTPKGRMAREGSDRLKGHYFDLTKPRLRAEVLAQNNTLPPFELAD